jgi:hypothetical protein
MKQASSFEDEVKNALNVANQFTAACHSDRRCAGPNFER